MQWPFEVEAQLQKDRIYFFKNWILITDFTYRVLEAFKCS